MQEFLNKYKGNPISIFATGGGLHFCGLMGYPGISKILSSIVIPYSKEAIENYCLFYNIQESLELGKCSKLATEIYYRNLCIISPKQSTCIVINAALTTNRTRRGENRCHVIINGDYYELKFTKLDDIEYQNPDTVKNKRLSEDQEISDFLLKILLERYNAEQ